MQEIIESKIVSGPIPADKFVMTIKVQGYERKKMPRSNPDKPLDAVIADVLALGSLKEDRSIAVMASAILEYWLGRAILGRLIEMTNQEKDCLLDNNGHGALANMSSKIWMGFALGLYKAEARKDLLNLKDIRNKFAHADEHIEFSNPEIVKLCNKLKAPKYLAESAKKTEQTIPKERFLDTVHHLVAGFHLATKFHNKRPPPPDTIQY